MKRITILLLTCVSGLWATISGFAVDVVVYRGSEDAAPAVREDGGLAEAVWTINRGTLAFARADNSWLDTVEFKLTFKSAAPAVRGGVTLDTATLVRIVEVPQGAMVTEARLLFDKYSVRLPVGEWTLTLQAKDMGDGDSLFAETNFTIRERAEGMSLSDIALLANLSIDTIGGIFTYGNYKMLPNPARVFDISMPIMYVYAEVYRPENAGSLLVSVFEILKENGDPAQGGDRAHGGETFRSYPPETTLAKSKDTYIINGFNVMGLPEGNYILRLNVFDYELKDSIFATRSFAVNKSVPLVAAADTNNPGDENLEQEYEYVSYLLSVSEKSFLDRLSDDGKREYIARWWEEHDTLHDTPQNEFRDDAIERWHYANVVFDEGGDPAQGGRKTPNGWHTDRGRVYIKYGPPDNIERNPITIESNSWEQWDYYSVEGGVTFIFADALGIGNYKLVHSTAKGELSNPNWKDKLLRRRTTTSESEQ